MCDKCMDAMTSAVEAFANGEAVETPAGAENMLMAGMEISLNPDGTVTATMPREAFATIMAAAIAFGAVRMGPILHSDEDGD